MTNLYGYILFAFVACVTPGPNNFMLFSYGKSYGLRLTLPFMTGIATGFFTLLVLCGYGIGKLIMTNEFIGYILKIVASLWFIYLAIMIRKINLDSNVDHSKQLGFKEAFFMQFINPKAWIMAVGGAALFLPAYQNIHLNVLLFALIFNMIGIPCMFIWTLSGGFISGYLKSGLANKIFGYSMASLMVLSVVLIWFI